MLETQEPGLHRWQQCPENSSVKHLEMIPSALWKCGLAGEGEEEEDIHGLITRKLFLVGSIVRLRLTLCIPGAGWHGSTCPWLPRGTQNTAAIGAPGVTCARKPSQVLRSVRNRVPDPISALTTASSAFSFCLQTSVIASCHIPAQPPATSKVTQMNFPRAQCVRPLSPVLDRFAPCHLSWIASLY